MNVKKILVVDDESGIRDLFRFLLEPEGYEVAAANDGPEAIGKIRSGRYDMVFLDVHMPGMTGPEALKAILRIRPDQTVVVFSSSSDPDFASEDGAVRNGAFDCVYKPFNIDDILDIIEKAKKR